MAKKKAPVNTLKRHQRFWVPPVASIYTSPTPRCLVRATLQSLTVKDDSVTVVTREFKDFTLHKDTEVRLAK